MPETWARGRVAQRRRRGEEALAGGGEVGGAELDRPPPWRPARRCASRRAWSARAARVRCLLGEARDVEQRAAGGAHAVRVLVRDEQPVILLENRQRSEVRDGGDGVQGDQLHPVVGAVAAPVREQRQPSEGGRRPSARNSRAGAPALHLCASAARGPPEGRRERARRSRARCCALAVSVLVAEGEEHVPVRCATSCRLLEEVAPAQRQPPAPTADACALRRRQRRRRCAGRRRRRQLRRWAARRRCRRARARPTRRHPARAAHAVLGGAVGALDPRGGGADERRWHAGAEAPRSPAFSAVKYPTCAPRPRRGGRAAACPQTSAARPRRPPPRTRRSRRAARRRASRQSLPASRRARSTCRAQSARPTRGPRAAVHSAKLARRATACSSAKLGRRARRRASGAATGRAAGTLPAGARRARGGPSR